MTLNDVQRASLALFAARAAGKDGSLEQMKAIALCIRKRVWDGWYDGSWLAVIEHADESMANPPGQRFYLDASSRILQRLIADIDDIYFSSRPSHSPTYASKTAQNFSPNPSGGFDAVENCCYWMFLNQPIRDWFQEHILNHPAQHAHRGQMGLMLFLE